MLVGEVVGCEGGGRPISIDRSGGTESVIRMREIEGISEQMVLNN